MRSFAIALLHHPVKSQAGGIITTSITNLDLHDIARTARTFGADRYYVVHPVLAQRQMVERVVQHWTLGPGARRVEHRKPALGLVRAVPTLEDAQQDFGGGAPIETWVTSAEPHTRALDHGKAARLLRSEGVPVLLAFGTGWGLSEECLERASERLAPIEGACAPGGSRYNHLSVRAAVAILLDRLVSGSLERAASASGGHGHGA